MNEYESSNESNYMEQLVKWQQTKQQQQQQSISQSQSKSLLQISANNIQERENRDRCNNRPTQKAPTKSSDNQQNSPRKRARRSEEMVNKLQVESRVFQSDLSGSFEDEKLRSRLDVCSGKNAINYVSKQAIAMRSKRVTKRIVIIISLLLAALIQWQSLGNKFNLIGSLEAAKLPDIYWNASNPM